MAVDPEKEKARRKRDKDRQKTDPEYRLRRSLYSKARYANDPLYRQKQIESAKNSHSRNRDWRLTQMKSITRKPLNIFKKSIRDADRRDLSWTITENEFKFLRSLFCYYCEGDVPLAGSGLDRIDNSIGYEYNNVLPCCTACNQTRGPHYTVEETKFMITNLKEYRKQRGVA